MGRRSDHTREELRSMILEAAQNIVETEGHQSLTARAVTRRIGYTVGTLYQVFASLNDLKMAVTAVTVARLRAHIVDGTRDISDPRARLRQMSHRYIEYAAAHPALWSLAFEHLSGVGHPPAITRETEAVFDCVGRMLSGIAPGIPAERAASLAAAFWSAVHGVCHLAMSHKLDLATAEPPAHTLDELIDMLYAGLERA
jgi:AcrR family transcriptional regulator